MKEIKGLKPFTKFLMTIGELPSSYLVSMTYEEQLLWFCNYLQNVVIPTINNNSEAVVELQEFVSNYFDNLDVQDEIDHKLNEMAESGELAEIIAAYISVNAIFSYDTIADMAASEVLEDGNDVYCLGKDTYNDGKGAFYKIREITISDVIDGYNIVAITNSEDLIGERLPNYEINQINTAIANITDTSIPNLQGQIDTLNNTTIPAIQGDITTINNTTIPAIQGDINTINNTTIPAIQGDINTINNTTIPGIQSDINTINNTTIPGLKADLIDRENNIQSLVVIADSYGVMDEVTNFPNYMKQYLGLDNDHFYNNSYGGTGFDHVHNNKKFNTLVNECADNLSAERRSAVTHVLFAGGYNDQWSTDADLQANIALTLDNARTVFPNAKIFVAHIGWSTNSSDLVHTYRNYYLGTTLNKNAMWITNSQNILRGDLMALDKIHPNADGSAALAQNLLNGLLTGTCSPNSGFQYLKDTNNNNLGVVRINNDNLVLDLYDNEFSYTGTADGTQITYCTLADNSMISGHNGCNLVTPCMFVGGGEYTMGICTWEISERVVKLKPIALNAAGNAFKSFTSIRFYSGMYVIPHSNI